MIEETLKRQEREWKEMLANAEDRDRYLRYWLQAYLETCKRVFTASRSS